MPTWSERVASAALRPLLLLIGALIVLHWKIGPVVLTFTPGHGVHLGDALALLPGLGAVLPHRRLRLDRRLGMVAPLTPNPMRRASDRALVLPQDGEAVPGDGLPVGTGAGDRVPGRTVREDGRRPPS